MSKYSVIIQDILRNANSKKITDRKKCIVELLQLYENDEAVMEISENTQRNLDGIANWTSIIHTVHKLVLYEADRFATKDNSNKTERQNTCAVVLKTVQNANRNKIPLLKCSDIVPLALQILETRIYEYYHDTYMYVLVTYILPIRAYQINMLMDQWQELLKICISLYKSGSVRTSKRTILDALQMIVDYGCLYSNLLLDVKKMLPFLENVFLDVKVSQDVLSESAYKLCNAVCQRIGTECRMALCLFSENLLSDVISLNSSLEKYKLLLLFVQIHHPRGVKATCEGAYAHNWEKWNAILKSLCLMILKDIKPDVLPASLVYLACEGNQNILQCFMLDIFGIVHLENFFAVFKQVFETPNLISEVKSFDDSVYLQPSKRRRIATRIDDPLDMIVDSSIEEAWPIIQILTVVLDKYPECLKREQFTLFLKVLVELLAQFCKQEIIVDSLYRLAAVLLKNEKSVYMKGDQDSNMYWDKIWDILLRSLNMNQNEASGHTLAQLYIEHNKIINPNALLRMYLTHAMKWSTMSLRTLIVFCEHVPLPVDVSEFNINASLSTSSNPVRLNLLQWLLNVPWQKVAMQITVDEYCSLLIGITLKSKYERKLKFHDYGVHETCNCLQNTAKCSGPESMDFNTYTEYCHLSMVYKSNLFTEEEEECVGSNVKTNDDTLHIQDVLTHLTDYLCDVKKEGPETEDLCVILRKITVIAKVVSTLKQLNVISVNVEESVLGHAMKSYLDSASNILNNIVPSRSKFVYLLNVTKSLNVLYETSYDRDVARTIVVSSPLNMLKDIFSLMNIEDSDVTDYDTFNDYYQDRRKRSVREVNEERCNFCKGGVIRTLATRALALFCCMDVGGEKFEMQISLMKKLLKVNMYDLTRTVEFRMAIIVLESLMKYDKVELKRNHEDAPVNVLLQLYRQCYKDETAVRYILNILPYFFKYAMECDYKPQDLTHVLSQLHIRISERRYGFMVHGAFVKCLSKIAKIDPTFAHSKNYAESETVPIVETVLSYLGSPLYVIRLEAVRCVRELYSLRDINPSWKEIFFRKIEETVNNLFIINRHLEEHEKADEREARVASALLVLTAIIYSNGTLQCRALLTMFRLTTDKQIAVCNIRKALKTIESRISYSNLIEDNLSYIFSYWLNSEYSIATFPWTLANCETEEEFQRRYINVLVLIKLQNLNVSDAVNLCNHVELQFERVLENIFPQVLAWLVYCICEGSELSTTQRARKIFHGLLSNRNEFSVVKKFSALFHEKFAEILIYLVERLHDEEYVEESLKVHVSFSKSDPPHFTKDKVDACLKYMELNLFPQEKSLQYVLARNCTHELQRILLRLIDNVYKKQFLEHKLKAFHQYTYFCTIIIRELGQDYFDKISMFLVREIGYSLLHLISGSNDTLAKVACEYLYTFVKGLLPARSKEVEDILNFSVTTLSAVVQAERIPMALKILQFLIIEQKDTLHGAIERLNSFPNIPIYREIRNVHNALKYKTETSYTLEKEIQHFLKAVPDKHVSCSVEDISYLRLQLSTRKEELRELYNKLETLRGFAEDCASSMLHQLIHVLIKLTASSDSKVSMEAAKCLGELGPTDLTTMILQTQKGHIKETSDLIEILSYNVVTLLAEFLIQNDMELRKVSAGSIYAVFLSLWGQKLLDAKYMKHLKTVLGEAQMRLCMSYIQPFMVSSDRKMTDVSINKKNLDNVMDPCNANWTTKSDGSYNEWIVDITCDIAKCFSGFYSESLVPVFRLSTDLCESTLPRMIFLMIFIDEKLGTVICSCVNRFFEYQFNTAKDANDSSAHAAYKTVCCDRRIVHCMLNIVNYIRIQVADTAPLDLDYMYIAKAAQYCSAFFTAILYAEISCENALKDVQQSISIPKIDYVCEVVPERGRIIQNILRDTYLIIGDPDAIYGCGSSHLQDHSSRVQHYIHTRKWDKVILTQDVELSFGNYGVIREMANGLHQSGLQHLLGHFVSTISKTGEKIDDDVLYDCAWRLSDWSLCEANHTFQTQNRSDSKSQVIQANYNFYHYQALKCFHESNELGVRNAIGNARMSIIKELKNISLESSKTIYEKLMQLLLICEIEELSFAKQEDHANILQKWKERDIVNSNEFQYVEPILMQRTVMYQIKDVLRNNAVIEQTLLNTYLEIAKVAAKQEHLHIAARTLAVLAKQPHLPPKIQDKLLYHESLMAWHTKELEVGRFILRSLINKESLDLSLRANVLRVYGDWMAETKSENPQTVIKKYYIESINTSNSVKEQTADVIKNLHDTRVALARFADAQFEQISAYMRSPQFESLQECISYSCRGISIDATSKDQDLRRAMIISQKQNTNDVAELEHIQREKNNYLLLALQYYLITLQQSENYNLLIFRVVALWLDNRFHEEVNNLLRTDLDKIPSFKFIPLIPQLAAHVSNVVDEFSTKIYKIMERCALEHPHHTLPVLLALKNLYGDYEYKPSKINAELKEEARVLGAKKLLGSLEQTKINRIVREMEVLSHSLVMLANLSTKEYNTTQNKTGASNTFKIPKRQEILRVKNFSNTVVPTLTMHVKPSGDYNEIIGISKYSLTFDTVGGVNAPKKVVCVGMDGISRHQLVKGQDDLRQDAVMQQVFNVMNTLLKACKETKRRKLMIRTYKVVPLTQRSGVLEWCDNTLPILTALLGSGTVTGLHRKYYPKDYTPGICRDKLAKCAKASNDLKLKVFMDCCANMHPALHYFFTEKYPSPEIWFERRLAYTRSVATTSMAGYILGLGDRHLSNILIDETTAEVIHIDFGIAFEQGKVLPIPETVPFRLTRNIEAAMGVSGVEGTMRRCCEKTLTVLRDQKQIIITLLQVLLYDPLFTWAITPAKAHNIQSGTASDSGDMNQGSMETNKTAERALLRIEQKLQGTEEGLASSVSGQVERLIQQARDPSNLCRLFCGWQPYL